MANHVRGRACLIKVKNLEGQFVPVAGQRGGSLSRTVENIDVSSKDMESREIELTYLTWTLSVDGLYKLSDNGFALLEKAFSAKEEVEVQFATADVIYSGKAYISELSFDASYEDVMTYSATIEGNGDLEASPVSSS